MARVAWPRLSSRSTIETGRANGLARGFLVFLILLLPWAGLVLYEEAAFYNQQYPGELEFMYLYAILGIIALVGIALVLVGIFMLLGLVAKDDIFTPAALRWADIVLGALTGIAFLSLFVLLDFVTNGFFGLLGQLHTRVGGPGVLLLFAGLTAVAFIFRWLMIVMRGLLAEAISNRQELAEVI